MVAALVVLLGLMYAVRIVLLMIGETPGQVFVKVRQFQASLAENLPPDVRAEMKPKPGWLNRPIGQVDKNVPPNVQADMTPIQPDFAGFVVIAAVLCLLVVEAWTRNGKPSAMLFVGFGLAVAVAFAARAATVARTWLERRNPGEVLVDLSPYPLAGAIRRISWLQLVMAAPILCVLIVLPFTGLPTARGWLILTGLAAVMSVNLLPSLMYSDRVWLAERGLYFGGRLYPWDGFERVAWTDDGRAFALRRRGRWRLRRWTLVPVPEGSREAAEKALRQVVSAPTPNS